jgi:serine protease AprX
LVKVSEKRNGFEENLIRAVEWVIKHREEFSIRIVNISLGCSYGSAKGYLVDRAIEEAVAAGLIVVTAAGNDPHQPISPPASALPAITVGGVDDQNILFQERIRMYHSSYGAAIQGYVKPEVIAPAIWLAAPLLPGSLLYYESLILHRLLEACDTEIITIFQENKDRLTLPKDTNFKTPDEISKWAEERMVSEKLVARYYQHVDGTSFAAPITCSVIAQMLEINPGLRAEEVKRILIGTAKKIDGISPLVQGFGVISPV